MKMSIDVVFVLKRYLDVSEKPPVGKVPEYIMKLKKRFTAVEIKSISNLTVEEINDAVDEPEEYGLVKVLRGLGTAPYDFEDVEPTYALFLHFKGEGLDYEPFDDIKIIASAVAASSDYINGKALQELTKLPPVRINRAVNYLEDYDIIDVIKALGSAPFNFAMIKATRKTRQFVNENCR